MRLVIDTNLLISGSLWNGPPAALLDEIDKGNAELVMKSFEGIDIVSAITALQQIRENSR